jgi:hypothetical protein
MKVCNASQAAKKPKKMSGSHIPLLLVGLFLELVFSMGLGPEVCDAEQAVKIAASRS